MASTLENEQIAAQLNRDGLASPTGKPFIAAMIQWVRYTHWIPVPAFKRPEELTVNDLMVRFGVSRHVVYYWIERGLVAARQHKSGAPYRITVQPEHEQRLREWVSHSSRIAAPRHTEPAL